MPTSHFKPYDDQHYEVCPHSENVDQEKLNGHGKPDKDACNDKGRRKCSGEKNCDHCLILQYVSMSYGHLGLQVCESVVLEKVD